MIPIKNTSARYGLIAILFHWTMAILMISLLILGLYMVGLPISLQKLTLFGWHKELGMLVLGLGIMRYLWRLMNVLPKLPAHLSSFQKFAARSAHLFFYGFIVLMPLTGWLISSAAGLPVSFFGWFVLPDLIAPNPALMPDFIFVHQWLGYGLIALICGHTGAALLHHFYYKDDILKRMIS
jgi:cytochrome b561